MKKKLILLLSLLCALCCVFGLAACGKGGNDKKGGGEPIDLSKYLGTDAELSAMTPTQDKYFKFTELPAEDGKEVTYEISLNTEDYTGEDLAKINDWVIPATHNGKKVVQIAKEGFAFPAGKNISNGEYTNVYIQPGIERICEKGLRGSDYCAEIYILQLPSTLKVIEKDAVICHVFRAGTGLQTIESGNKIFFTGYKYGPEADKYKDNPFCLPDSLERCEAFGKTYSDGNGKTKSEDGVFYLGNPNNPYMIATDYQGVSGETVTLDKGCKIIQKEVFGFYKEPSIDLSAATNLTSIGARAFSSASLKTLTLPDSVKYIDSEAFDGCSSLVSVTLPNSAEKIASDAFANCDNIIGTISGKCMYLGSTNNPNYYLLRALAYENMNPDTQKDGYVIHENTKVIAAKAFSDACLVWDSTLAADPESAYFEVEEIAEKALSVVVPDGVYAIGESAFYGIEHYLRGVSFPGNWPRLHDDPDSRTEIKPMSYFLGNQFSLEDDAHIGRGEGSLIIREGYTEVEDEALANLGTFKSITLPSDMAESVNSSIDYLFGGKKTGTLTTTYSITCPAYLSYIVPDSRAVHFIDNSGTTMNIFQSNYLESVTLKDGITKIIDDAFNGCGKLKKITIPTSVTAIGDRALANCGKLEEIVFLGTAEQWDGLTFGVNWNKYAGNFAVTCSDDKAAKN